MIYKSLTTFLLGGAWLVAFGSLPPTSHEAEAETSASIPHDRKVPRVPAGRIAFHFVGRTFFPHPTTGQVELLAYITYLDGLPGPFFSSGTPGEETARFTMRVTNLEFPQDVTDDPTDSNIFVLPPGSTFDVYFNESPNQDWAQPDSFSDETRIATFLESALQSASGINFFSNDLVDSTAIRVDGMKLDFKHLVPGGVTISNVRGDRVTAAGGTALYVPARSRSTKEWHTVEMSMHSSMIAAGGWGATQAEIESGVRHLTFTVEARRLKLENLVMDIDEIEIVEKYPQKK